MLRAVGERDEVAYACGYSPKPVRYAAVAFGGFMAGVGGAYLSVAYTLNWIEGMTQGRGIVAVALVIFASWSPLQAIFASYLFGGAQALQLALQSVGVGSVAIFAVDGAVSVDAGACCWWWAAGVATTCRRGWPPSLEA